MTKASVTDRENAIAQLRELLKPGDTVYTILRHVTAMQDNRPQNINGGYALEHRWL